MQLGQIHDIVVLKFTENVIFRASMMRNQVLRIRPALSQSSR